MSKIWNDGGARRSVSRGVGITIVGLAIDLAAVSLRCSEPESSESRNRSSWDNWDAEFNNLAFSGGA